VSESLRDRLRDKTKMKTMRTMKEMKMKMKKKKMKKEHRQPTFEDADNLCNRLMNNSLSYI